MLALCEIIVSHLVKVSQMMDTGVSSMGQVARAKAMSSSLARDICLLAREVCGGNGIILDNHVMK
jgi:alkylation response protein AidB-like acyl-CoA dehydrogenase